MDYMTVKEVSEKWQITSRMAAYYCASGRIPGAEKKGNVWFVPRNAVKPEDKRFRKETHHEQSTINDR